MKRHSELLIVDVYIDAEVIESAFKFDPDSGEFRDFEDDILDALEVRGYELQDEMYSNRNSSKSRYYMYTKVQNNQLLEILLKIRVSDHPMVDRVNRGQLRQGSDLSDQFSKHYAEDLIQNMYPESKKVKIKNIDIVFDNQHYQSYDDALNAILDRVDRIKPRK